MASVFWQVDVVWQSAALSMLRSILLNVTITVVRQAMALASKSIFPGRCFWTVSLNTPNRSLSAMSLWACSFFPTMPPCDGGVLRL